jgi:hypothetical protein
VLPESSEGNKLSFYLFGINFDILTSSYALKLDIKAADLFLYYFDMDMS